MLRALFFWNIRLCCILQERNPQPHRHENLKKSRYILLFRVLQRMFVIQFNQHKYKKYNKTKHIIIIIIIWWRWRRRRRWWWLWLWYKVKIKERDNKNNQQVKFSKQYFNIKFFTVKTGCYVSPSSETSYVPLWSPRHRSRYRILLEFETFEAMCLGNDTVYIPVSAIPS